MRTIICERCKEKVETNSSARKYCEQCAKIVAREKKRISDREYDGRRRAMIASKKRYEKKKHEKTLKEIAEEARAHGISYGQWVAMDSTETPF